MACALSRELHSMGYLTYILDGDNIRHGLNRDLSFKAEDRAENIRRVGKCCHVVFNSMLSCRTCVARIILFETVWNYLLL